MQEVASYLLKTVIAEHFEASDKMLRQLLPMLKARRLKPGEPLWLQGSSQSHLFFLVAGLLYAHFHTREGKSVCKEIYWQHDLVFGFRSLLMGIPLPFAVTAVEASCLYQISVQDYQALINTQSEWSDFHFSVVSKYFMYKEGKEEFLLLNTPQQRVQAFYQLYPELVKRVPQHIIASYLGMTPISFSRIKKRLQNQPNTKIYASE